MNKLILLLAILYTGLCTFHTPTHAQSDFSLDFNVDYLFSEQGNATVTKRITLTNLNSESYPSVYLVDVPDDASSIAAVNENGKLEYSMLEEGGRKMVRIELPVQSVGFNQKTNMTLSFETRTLSQKIGDTWQIVIPPFSTDENIISYNTRVVTPDTWGPATHTSPAAASAGTWTLEEQGTEAISLTFGDMPEMTRTKNQPQQSGTAIAIAGILGGIIITVLLYFFFKKRMAKPAI